MVSDVIFIYLYGPQVHRLLLLEVVLTVVIMSALL